ncbi:MAG: hypothetical protein SPG61_02330, partial [Arcanobacterium sp.]|nr:hypothetical protein [Arcanobacterium sp.]
SIDKRYFYIDNRYMFNKSFRFLFFFMVMLWLFGLLLTQIIVPFLALEMAAEFPEVNHLVMPYSIMGISSILFLQIASVLLAIVVTRGSKVEFFHDTTRKLIKVSGALLILAFFIPTLVGFHFKWSMDAGGLMVVLTHFFAIVMMCIFLFFSHISLSAFDNARRDYEELGAVI